MTSRAIISNEQQFINNATDFFNTIFESCLNAESGDIEIRTFPKDQAPQQFFCKSESEAAQNAYQLCNMGIDVYVGVNPRTGGSGKKENIHYLAAFHAEVDYGADGHREKPMHASYDEALAAVKAFKMKPTILNHSGGGFHCYWVLNTPLKVEERGVELLEDVNKALLQHLGGDGGTHDISRVLRVPGTFNFKLADNPREVTSSWMDGPEYVFDDFLWLIEEAQAQKSQEDVKKKPQKPTSTQNHRSQCQDIDHLALSDKIKSLILNGNDGTYPSRSEADQAVITVLVNKGMDFSEIKKIFETHQIGEKFREHKSQDKYLQKNIDRAKEFSNLTEQEMQDPLFISGSLRKNESGKYNIDVVRFQEYMTKKWKLKYLEDETTFFRFNGKCYEVCKRDSLNHLCQKDLGGHRGLFSIQVMGSFIHFGIAANLIDSEKASSDQTRYLTLQNGLFDLVNYELVPHNSSIYTTNLLPYDYDPTAKCPRFLQYFDEVFMGDKDTINVIQEAMGYTFYKSIPKPAMFFLIGGGGNGKSVFITTLMNLCGDENASSISLNLLSKEYYLLDLFGKMINVSSETPSKRLLNADQIKAVVAGDMISARKPYENPTKFRPFAKHFIAMNERPLIDDPTYGMWRRIYMIDFPRRFSEKEMDVYLTEKLKTELSGIFNWALEGFKRLRDREFRFEESNSMKASKQDYKDQSNSALSFASEGLEKSTSEESLQFKKVYEEYEKYCEKDGFSTRMKKKEFRKTLEKAGYLIENSSKHSNELRIFGVRLS